MTAKQFDAIYLELQRLASITGNLVNRVTSADDRLAKLESKTLVVTTLDQDLEKLKIDVAALIDEREES